MIEGFWMVRCCRGCPEVAARVWWCSHEPGVPENEVDQPYLQGQIGLDLVPPSEVLEMVEFVESSIEEQARLSRTLPMRTAVRAGEAQRLDFAPMALWKRSRARRITEAEYRYHIKILMWAEKYAPNDYRLAYRTPIEPLSIPIPKFST